MIRKDKKRFMRDCNILIREGWEVMLYEEKWCYAIFKLNGELRVVGSHPSRFLTDKENMK